ncbi:MAG: pilus assembly PilX N-terminal domain-containing protein, partial [Acidobacteriota bacterium]
MKTRNQRSVQAARREEGSAYIITLMVMFALTVIGLGLSLVSQTELLVGSQERSIQRNFYAADSGLNAALAAVLA